jgi:DNA-binding HxlR family transcriptional regulator
MKKRSNCPLSIGLELIGDKWSLLIIRDILHYEKMNFKDLMISTKGISTSVLSKRLKNLLEKGILKREISKTSKKVIDYSLTSKGKDLQPVITEISQWSKRHMPLSINIEL